MRTYNTEPLKHIQQVVKDVYRELRPAHRGRVPREEIRLEVNKRLPPDERIKAYTMVH